MGYIDREYQKNGTRENYIMHENDFICPFSQVEKRLLDSLSLFLEVKKNYFEPEAFRLSLNNLIQTLRNITFIPSLSNEEYLKYV